MKLFDSHCHLDDSAFESDLEAVINRADNTGVEKLMTVGINMPSASKAVAIAETRPGIYASVGVHPHDVKDCNELTLDFLRNLAKNPNVHAWGEIGLDYNRMFSPRKDQEKWLVRQLEVADELNLPLIFHERDSKGRFLEILKTHHDKGRKAVVHCFSGNKAELEQYIEIGFYIGITGILTLKSRGAELRELAPLIPVEQLLVETDAPYLTPAPEKNRFRRNEPAFVKSVLLKLAEVIKEDPEYLATVIWGNTCRLFNIETF